MILVALIASNHDQFILFHCGYQTFAFFFTGPVDLWILFTKFPPDVGTKMTACLVERA